MAAQVQLRVGIAAARLPADNMFFVRIAAGLSGALRWLDARLGDVLGRLHPPRALSLFEVTLFCLVEHIVFFPTVPLEEFRELRTFAARFAERPAAVRTPFRFDPNLHLNPRGENP
jgi:hypothetical protein